jgi:asparagine synthase (glutamine-hydrolysing)
VSNFLLIIDADRLRRERHVAAANGVWHRFTDTAPIWTAGEDYAFAANETASREVAPDGRFGALIGVAFRDSTGTPLVAADLLSADHESAERLEGLHVLVRQFAAGTWHISADLLGIMPVYWWQTANACIVASSPELIRAHPAFVLRVDVTALTGILLTGIQIGSNTIATGVRRLPAGAVLSIGPYGSATELAGYDIAPSRDGFGLLWKHQLHQLHEVLCSAFIRHTPTHGRWFTLLSGGLDSRMVAAYLAQQDQAPAAVTFGDDTDIEMRCAAAVAKALHWRHQHLPIAADQYVRSAAWQAGWTYLVGGLNNFEYWQCRDRLARFGSHFVSGFAMDAVAGGSHMAWGFDKTGTERGFDVFFSSAGRYGLTPKVLQRLFPSSPIGEALASVRESAKADFEAVDGEVGQRAWRFDLRNRQRLHVGTFAWTLAQGAWPVLPALDSRVLHLMAGLPPASFSERRAQIEILRAHFNRLAALPLDRNSTNDMPLAPTLTEQLRRAALARVRHLWRGRRPNGSERRYYFRLYDFNGPGWKSVRARAEAGWKRLDGLVDLRAVRELVPPADVDVPFRDGIIDSNGRKLLVGLALWAEERL